MGRSNSPRRQTSSQGAVQTFGPYVVAHTLDGAKQMIALGPYASQEAIKDLGNNGGGQFNANSAHPFTNPNGFTNQFQLFLELIFLTPKQTAVNLDLLFALATLLHAAVDKDGGGGM